VPFPAIKLIGCFNELLGFRFHAYRDFPLCCRISYWQLFGAQLKAVLSSDIGHWDVRNMDRVMPHAFSLVEQGLLTEDQFREFTFANPARLHTALNPGFFDGTPVEAEVRALTSRSEGPLGPPG